MGAVDLSVKGTPALKRTFLNTILASNIEVWKYLAKLFFENDMERIVWASSDKMFKMRSIQLQNRKNHTPTGLLDMPFCSFHLTSSPIQPTTQRPWFSQALNVEGMYLSELGTKLKMTPVTLNYEGVFCCQHDTDFQWAQQAIAWQQSNETLIRPVVSALAKDGITPIEIPIIGVAGTAIEDSRFTESDWLVQNKIQAFSFSIPVQTYLLAGNSSGFGLVKHVVLNFLGELFPDKVITGELDEALQEFVFSEA